jgi:hypothetical protein
MNAMTRARSSFVTVCAGVALSGGGADVLQPLATHPVNSAMRSRTV